MPAQQQPVFQNIPIGTKINLVIVGDSLPAGTGATSVNGVFQDLLGQLLLLSFCSARTPTIVSRKLTHAGYTWPMLDAIAAEVDNAWISGYINIRIDMAGTNDIVTNGGSPATAAANAATYNLNRRAVHPWISINNLTIPRRGGIHASFGTLQAGVTNANDALLDYNNRMRAGFRNAGYAAIVDWRDPESPLNMPNWLIANFDGGTIWNTPAENGAQIHGNNAMYAIGAERNNFALNNLSITV